MAWVDEVYTALFAGGSTGDVMDADDALWAERIKNADSTLLEKVVRDCVRVINSTQFLPDNWDEYKANLLDHERGWGAVMFRWDVRPLSQSPPRGQQRRALDVVWEEFAALSQRRRCELCYILYLAFSDLWFFGEELPSFYDVFEEESEDFEDAADVENSRNRSSADGLADPGRV